MGAIVPGNIWICSKPKCEYVFETEEKVSEPCPKCGCEKVFKKKQLDLYGSTRHSTTTEIVKRLGSKKAKAALGNTANKSIERYCQWQDDGTFEVINEIENLKHKPVKGVKLDDKK